MRLYFTGIVNRDFDAKGIFTDAPKLVKTMEYNFNIFAAEFELSLIYTEQIESSWGLATASNTHRWLWYIWHVVKYPDSYGFLRVTVKKDDGTFLFTSVTVTRDVSPTSIRLKLEMDFDRDNYFTNLFEVLNDINRFALTFFTYNQHINVDILPKIANAIQVLVYTVPDFEIDYSVKNDGIYLNQIFPSWYVPQFISEDNDVRILYMTGYEYTHVDVIKAIGVVLFAKPYVYLNSSLSIEVKFLPFHFPSSASDITPDGTLFLMGQTDRIEIENPELDWEILRASDGAQLNDSDNINTKIRNYARNIIGRRNQYRFEGVNSNLDIADTFPFKNKRYQIIEIKRDMSFVEEALQPVEIEAVEIT